MAQFLNTLVQFDHWITLTISQSIPHTPLTDMFFLFLSLRGFSLPIWLIILGLLFIKEYREDKSIIPSFGISMAATGFIVQIVLKNLFQRVRPVAGELGCPTDFGFPSGHASIAFAAATILAYYDWKRRYFYFFVAFMIALSRIYLGCHYILDIGVGALIGTGISICVLYAAHQTLVPANPVNQKRKHLHPHKNRQHTEK